MRHLKGGFHGLPMNHTELPMVASYLPLLMEGEQCTMV